MKKADYHSSFEISCTKLLPWLCSRGVLTQNWGDEEKTRKSAGSAIMNRLATNFSGDVLSTLSSPLICYYDFLTAFKTLEADPIVGKKNIFGQYQIEDMNTMWRCLKGWEDGRVHIAGAAECLAEKIQFEYPQIKKLASSLELHLANVTKRCNDLPKAIQRYELTYQNTCSNWSINGTDPRAVRVELQNNLLQIPHFIEKVDNQLNSSAFSECLIYYFKTSGREVPISEIFPTIASLIRTAEGSSGNNDVGADWEIVDGAQPLAVENRGMPFEQSKLGELLKELHELDGFMRSKLAEGNATEEGNTVTSLREVIRDIMAIISDAKWTRYIDIYGSSEAELNKVSIFLANISDRVAALKEEQRKAEFTKTTIQTNLKECTESLSLLRSRCSSIISGIESGLATDIPWSIPVRLVRPPFLTV